MLGVTRNFSIIFLSYQFKFYGILYINDDQFVTMCVVVNIFANILIRYYYGRLIGFIGFFGSIYFAGGLAVIADLIGFSLSLTRSKVIYFLFCFFSRVSTALLSNINFNFPYVVFGRENGLKSMKLMDFQVISSFSLSCLCNYFFTSIGHLNYIFLLFFVTDLIAIIGYRLFYINYVKKI